MTTLRTGFFVLVSMLTGAVASGGLVELASGEASAGVVPRLAAFERAATRHDRVPAGLASAAVGEAAREFRINPDRARRVATLADGSGLFAVDGSAAVCLVGDEGGVLCNDAQAAARGALAGTTLLSGGRLRIVGAAPALRRATILLHDGGKVHAEVAGDVWSLDLGPGARPRGVRVEGDGWSSDLPLAAP